MNTNSILCSWCPNKKHDRYTLKIYIFVSFNICALLEFNIHIFTPHEIHPHSSWLYRCFSQPVWYVWQPDKRTGLWHWSPGLTSSHGLHVCFWLRLEKHCGFGEMSCNARPRYLSEHQRYLLLKDLLSCSLFSIDIERLFMFSEIMPEPKCTWFVENEQNHFISVW